MNWKKRLTNYNFWVSIVSAILLILQAFDINFDIAYINEIATAILGLLVVIGIVSDPTKSNTNVTNNVANNTTNSKEQTVEQNNTIENKDENKNNEENNNEDMSSEMMGENVVNIPTVEQNENNTTNIQDDFKILLTELQRNFDSINNTLNQKNQNSVEINKLSEAINTQIKEPNIQIQDYAVAQNEEQIVSENSVDQTISQDREENKTSYNIVN